VRGVSRDAPRRRGHARVLRPLNQCGIDCTVKVGPHGSHGSIGIVTLTHVAEDKRAAIIGEVETLIAPFVMRHEVMWA
jgi:fatty-acyl-CoA synthase